MIVVQITQNDIDEGVRGACFNCPMARALKRKFPDKRVMATTSEVLIGEAEFIYDGKVRGIILNYDITNNMEPFDVVVTPGSIRYSEPKQKKRQGSK
jgi:hypothetical protein